MIARQYNTSEDRTLLGNNLHFSHFVRPSRSISRNGSGDRDTSSSVNSAGRDDVHSKHTQNLEPPSTAWTTNWVPYTFRNSFMAVLSTIALGLCLTTLLLWWRSSTNYGLGKDDGTPALLFGWRYTPTMIAVIYVQMTAVLFEDVKRTEPFARLARPDGAEASISILKSPGAWWNALYDGFAKKKNGWRSWVLIYAALVNILGFLVISPLSSAYLFSGDVIVPRMTDFVSLTPRADSPLPIDADRTTHFRTIANLLQNVSTSPWITDEYTILPFWPSSLKDAPITSLPSISSQKWEAKTMAFKTDLNCKKMNIQAQTSQNVQYAKSHGKINSTSIIWESDGCEYGLSVDKSFFQVGGGSWSDASTFYYALSALGGGGSPHFSSNKTAECEGKEILIVTNSWESKKAIYEAQLCDTRYYMANITTSVTLTDNDPHVFFDKKEFQQKQTSIPDSLLNTTEFRKLTLDANWPTYMISILWSNTALLGGPTVLLGAVYNYNMTALFEDPNWIASAAKAKQRYFGEVLQAALNHPGASQRVTINGQVHDVENRVLVQAGVAVALGSLFAISFSLLLIVWWSAQLKRRPLNLKQDPTATMGASCLLSNNARTRSDFQGFKQPSTKELYEALEGEFFFTDPQGLSRISQANAIKHNLTQSRNGTPKLLRLATLIALITTLVAVIVGISVLWHFAESTGLYEKAFVYQVNLSIISSSLSSIAPFSIIPTLIASGIGLWWSGIDDNLRRLTPYLEMSRRTQPLSRGAHLSYQSSFWLWACVKAALNKHWLLSLLTLGSTLSPVFTIAMSALFDRGPGDISRAVNLQRSIEIREIPFVFPTEQSYYPDASNDYAGVILADLYRNLSAHWMYTAAIQLTLNGSQPSWSKDGWSFVPVNLDDINNQTDWPHVLDKSDQSVAWPETNVSLSTPALRGRIECSVYPLETLMNLSTWLTAKDLTNATIWNRSTVPHDLQGGYQLGATYSDFPSAILPYAPSMHDTCPNCTTVFANPSEIVCCKNGSSSAWNSNVAVGYWSPNLNPWSWSTRGWNQNFTAKWFHGNAVTGIKTNGFAGNEFDIDLLFPSPPSVTMMNCRPLIESANAEITVNPSNGEIQTFNITSNPVQLTDAFADNFLPHNKTRFDRNKGMVYYNVTVSYGRLFMASMLTAADTLHIGGAAHIGGYTTEDLNDNTYNIRDEINGLNMDFMTYAMYSMANKDPTALLDPETFNKLSQKTFTTFFQHYVSNSISTQTGGWAYQKINASLPSDLGLIIELESGYFSEKGATASKYQDNMHPISHTNRTVTAHVSQRVELLQMNAVAVWLSIAILGWLILTTVIVAVLQKRYFGSLVRNVDCLGDVLVLIAGSVNLLEVVREMQAGRLSARDVEQLRTRLGWFVDSEGGLRWGIELEESFRGGPGVHWVSAPYFSKEEGANTWNFSDEERRV